MVAARSKACVTLVLQLVEAELEEVVLVGEQVCTPRPQALERYEVCHLLVQDDGTAVCPTPIFWATTFSGLSELVLELHGELM